MKKVLLLIGLLVFCESIFAQQYEPHWQDVNYHQYRGHKVFVASVELDNHLILSSDNYRAYEVAAFVGEHFRGHGFLKYYNGDLYPILEFEIYYKPIEDCILEDPNPDETPQPVSFKLYDHSTNTLYDYWTCDQVIVTQTPYNFYDADLNPIVSFFHTYTKEIDPYTTDGGYYLIASPVDEVMAKDVVGLRTPEFDFYSFDQNPEGGLEWINHRNQEEYPLQPGVGYLYANSTGEDLIFVGAPYAGDGKVTLAKEEGPNVEFPGWNLVGNPFAQTASIDRTEFYVMNGDGDEVITADRNYVNAMEGIFVIASEDGEELTFSPTTPGQGKGQIVLNLTEELGSTIDRAVVRFGQGGTLPKFMLNENNTKLYIPKNGKDFAVVRSNKSGKLPVNFKAAQEGVYTISVNVENLNNLRYLHLIDMREGNDIDLLQNPNYRFEAKTNDKANRFMLVFESKLVKELFATREGDSFSFFSNGNWIINNEGEAILQVVDVEGRILSSEEISGSVSKRIEASPGVYMLRLINGKDVKVQKIVVE